MSTNDSSATPDTSATDAAPAAAAPPPAQPAPPPSGAATQAGRYQALISGATQMIQQPLALIHNAFFHACIPPLVIFVVLADSIWSRQDEPNTPLTLAVFLVAAGGGVLSTYFRLKDVAPSRISHNEILQIYMTPLIAGLLGLVLYSLFLTGMIQGELFPKFTEGTKTYEKLADVFLILPRSNGDAAKALLWAFIAGFSEKLIPNILDQLADQIKEDNRKARTGDPSGGS